MECLPETLPDSPMPFISGWLADARADGQIPNPDAMALASVSSAGAPSNRIVLCKEVVEDPGYLVFYTNYESNKAAQIDTSGKVAGVFHWDHMNRQIRFEGIAVRSPAAESDAYFASRDKESQVGAWTSAQSRPIGSRQALLDKHMATARKLAELQQESGLERIPRPPSWGGYRIGLQAAELWVRGEARLHDRARWERDLNHTDKGFQAGPWSAERLQP